MIDHPAQRHDAATGGDPGRPDQGRGRAAPLLVLDTNVFVAAGFSPRSNSARILERVREGRWTMAWNRTTRRETEAVLAQIPPLSRRGAEDAFRPEAEFVAETHPERFGYVEDPDDRGGGPAGDQRRPPPVAA